MTSETLGDVWRREAPHVLGALVRKYGDFDGCEDACQEALAVAAREWEDRGEPQNPRAWLIRVAAWKLIDHRRSDASRAEREQLVGVCHPRDAFTTPDIASGPESSRDDSLQLLLLCCHPALTKASQVALTLRAVGGLRTEQIAVAFLVPTKTMAQRISRAKSKLRHLGARFDDTQVDHERVSAVLHALYLIFNEGYATSSGDRLISVSLTTEAIRLTRILHRSLPEHAEAAGLLALMLLTDARTSARVDPRGDLIPLSDQDRKLWDSAEIAEGVGILERVLPGGGGGPFQLQAAIAAVHAETADGARTDWPQIVALYRMLDRVAPSPSVTLNLGVAVGMAEGADAGLAMVTPLLDDPAARRYHRVHAVRAHLLERSGRLDQAVDEYALAAQLTSSTPEQRYLNRQARRLAQAGPTEGAQASRL